MNNIPGATAALWAIAILLLLALILGWGFAR